MRRFFIFGFFILMMSFGLATYSNPSSNWQANQPTFDDLYAGDFANYWPILNDMKDGQCNATTDFMIGIPPGGCSPSVVRSDLLAEQNVPVFCELYAIKVNPLIKVSSIRSISFKGDYPEGVRSIVYHPARAAIKSYSTLLGSPTLENIGYVVIILEQERVEANMEEWISGNLTATMTYDAEEAYGTGKGDYYLEPMSDDKWQNDYAASSFWNGRGYLRVLDVGDGGAKIQVLGSKDKVLRTLTLKEGETSSSSYLPGFYCKAGLKVKLTDITTQEDMARLNIDGQSIWVRDGSKFLDGKCVVKDLDIRGNNDGEIRISCSGSGVIDPLVLRGDIIRLRENADEDGMVNEYNLGDVYDEEKKHIVAYGRLDKSKEIFIVLADKMPESNILKDISVLEKSVEDFGEFEKKVNGIEKIDDVEVFLGDKNLKWFVGLGVENKNEEAVNDFFRKSVDVVRDELVAYYGSEEKEIGGTWAEEALLEEIKLAGELGQFETQKELMGLFLREYPLATTESYVRDMRAKLDGADYSESYVSAYVGDEFKSISVVDFKAVTEGAKTVDLRIGGRTYYNLTEEGKDGFVPWVEGKGGNGVDMGDVGRIEIDKILPGEVKVYFRKDKDNDDKSVRSEGKTIKEGGSEVFDGRRVYVENIEVNQVAHVSLIPDVKHEKSEADFSFRIGIEERAIELSPEKASRMIKNLDVSIAKWENIVERLGNVVTGLKGACFATSAVLMIKNMASGFSGEAAARTKVMGEYKEICKTQYSDKTPTECYNDLSKEIAADVEVMTAVIGGVNSKMEQAYDGNVVDSGGIFGGEAIRNSTEYMIDLKREIQTSPISVQVSGEKNPVLVPKSELYSVSQVRAVLTWEASQGKGNVEAVAKTEMDDALRNVALSYKLNKDANLAAEKLKDEWNVEGIGFSDISLLTDEKTVYYQWTGKTGKDYGVTDYEKEKVHAVRTLEGNSYLVVLSDEANGKMTLDKVLEKSGDGWKENEKALGELRSKNIAFLTGGTAKDCSNVWPKGTAKVSYYEAGDNAGLPAIVPFDTREGWYVMVSNSGGTFLDDSSQGYTASANVRHMKICNIGDNGLMENCGGDDLVQTFNVNTIGSVDKYGGCLGVDVKKLYTCAQNAIRDAASQNKEQSINIRACMNDAINLDKGKPMSQVGGFECQDFMSPDDCLWMFNVCDPVICPPSRCNFGGKWPVSDVIATGIIGSLVLCLPNAEEGIKIPICLSGVHAGIDTYLSILKSERDCLEHSLETGELVGICDQVSSIYKCEFFWRQMSPLMDQLVPGIIDYAIYGNRVRGGGEYALVTSAWENTKKSISYFKDVYAQNAFRAFNIRSTQEIGSSVCKAFIGTSVPGSASFIEDLLAPESPTQFYAQFSENLFTEATVPSTSQYKVYYHIYAGNDQGVQYKVYLRDPPATSYYASTPEITVDSGYIAAGSSKDRSKDFTAPSGYKELCVVINAQEECGFKSVTSSFGLDWVSKKYIEDQATEEDITSEKECVSGSPSALSMATLNLQAGVEEVVNPEIALRGIVRICASYNPGGDVTGVVTCDGADKSEDDCGSGFWCEDGVCVDKAGSGTVEEIFGRWKDVGYCGDVNLRCWLDVDSVKDDLGALEIFTGESYDALNERRGLIKNDRLDLLGVAVLLAKARGDVEGLLGISSQESVKSEGLKIVGELDRVIGNDSMAGAGTNNDRAQALALKASVYRLLSGKVRVIEADKVKKVIGARDVVEEVAEVVAEVGVEVVEVEMEDIEYIKEYIAGFEGAKDYVYEINGEKHIGIGHKITADSRSVFERELGCDTTCFDALLNDGKKLSDDQVNKLFDYEIRNIYLPATKRLFNHYDEYPDYVKKALVSSVYRGEMEESHDTVRLINEGEWRRAAVEYVNRVDYRMAPSLGLDGIVTRMNANRDFFLDYAVELEKEGN